MTPRRTRKQFRHAISRRAFPVAALSAALLAAAATGTLLLNEPDPSSSAHDASTTAVVDMALGGDSGRGGDRADRAARPQAASPAPAAPKPPSQRVLGYDFQEQPNFYYCGPAATRNALTARGFKLSQDEVANKLGTTTSGTNSANDTTRVLNSVIGSDVYKTHEIPGPATPAQMDQLQADVVRAVSDGYAVVANIDGSTTDTDGAWRSYPGGHYVTIVGYSDDGRTVKVADPAGIGGDGTYWVTTINMANWMAGHGYSA
ncbi:C39 family peptidase [Micromonospora sp. NPDC049679]|uniref:C39 family peptidase n=1 Tax=Micromonospora sp. NPDC049679 TaxID=3155920 RepID=UPI0033FFEB69